MPPSSVERPLAAIAAQFVSFMLISVNDVILKILVAGLPSWQLMGLRSSFALLWLLPFVIWQGLDGRSSITTRRPVAHLFRALLSAVSIFTYFEALRELDLPVATTILFVTPFFVVALSGLVLREKVTANRWIAVLIGFAGALIIIRPSPAGISPAALLALFSAATWGAAMVAIRNLAKTESTLTVLLYFNLFICVLATALALPGWVPVSWTTIGVIVVMAAIQLAAQVLMMIAFRFASASVTAPVQYSQLLWSVLSGWFVFAVLPGPHVVLGAAVIVASGLYLILSERRAT
jgi:drug/metabolite transporter (DMT)-like permease